MNTFFSLHPVLTVYLVYLIAGIVSFEYYTKFNMISSMVEIVGETKRQNRFEKFIFYVTLPLVISVIACIYIFSTLLIAGHLGLMIPLGRWYNSLDKQN